MHFVVTFDNCGLESPLKAQSAISALALAQEAERNGCRNVVVALPDGEFVPLAEFAAMHASGRLNP